MIKHKYNGWVIYNTGDGYVAERQSDLHFSPEKYRLLRDAKEAIDTGKAKLSQAQLKAKIYRTELELGILDIPLLEQMAHIGDKGAEIVLNGI